MTRARKVGVAKEVVDEIIVTKVPNIITVCGASRERDGCPWITWRICGPIILRPILSNSSIGKMVSPNCSVVTCPSNPQTFGERTIFYDDGFVEVAPDINSNQIVLYSGVV